MTLRAVAESATDTQHTNNAHLMCQPTLQKSSGMFRTHPQIHTVWMNGKHKRLKDHSYAS